MPPLKDIRQRILGSVVPALALSLAPLVCGTIARAADWPQWRGPNRDGISHETGWNAQSPKVLWKLNLGTGCSSFAVVKDRVFTMGNLNNADSVYCLDANTGKTFWAYTYPSARDAKMFDGGPCATPTIDGEFVYSLSRAGLLLCLKRETGAVVWSKEFQKEFGAKPPGWGYSASPLILDGKLFVDVGAKGASAVALDKATGTVVWKAGDDAASYSSPYGFTHGGKQCVAFFNAMGLVVREAGNGNELLRFPWKTSWDVNPTTPIVSGDKIFIASGYGRGGVLLPLGRANPAPIWQSKDMKNKMNSCALWQGCLYGFDESKLACIDFATGAVKWQASGMGLGSLMIADGKLIILAESGELVIAEASSKAFKQLSKTPAVGGNTWVTPVLSNGRIYCRNHKGDVVCFDVAKP
ncbi:MAG: PQQ-binding-like beta-propeller repeat protein [Verrucomicrobiota bacterium]